MQNIEYFLFLIFIIIAFFGLLNIIPGLVYVSTIGTFSVIFNVTTLNDKIKIVSFFSTIGALIYNLYIFTKLFF